MKVALDTNILSAIWSTEPTAFAVSEELYKVQSQGTLVLSVFTYLECRAHPKVTETSVLEFFSRSKIVVQERLPDAIWKLAGDRFALYADRRRSAGGHTPRRILADFLIGAHAVLGADRLMTLDAAFYKRNYPELQLHPPPNAVT